MHCLSTTNQRRRGFSAMELVLTLPIFMTLLFGMFEVALVVHARTVVIDASRTGSRLASTRNATTADIETAVRDALPDAMQRGLEVEINPGQHSGDTVSVTVKVPMLAASPDLLWPIGLTIEGQTLVAESRMVKE